MKQSDWQRAFGDAPDDFRRCMRNTLNDLEEKDMNKKMKLSTVLLAAALCAALLAGAALAVTQLGLFDFLTNTAEPLRPLEGADKLVLQNRGSTENELVRLDLEEAFYDGQGVLMKLRISPRDAEHFAMLNEFWQGASQEEYETENSFSEVAEGSGSFNWGEEAQIATIVNQNGRQSLLMNDVETRIPESEEEAIAQNLPVFAMDGKLYFADQREFRVIGRKDGREIIGYAPQFSFSDTRMQEWSGDARGEADGSAIIWQYAIADAPLDEDAITATVGASITDVEGNAVPLEPLTVTIPKVREEYRAKLVPMGDGSGERFQIFGGEWIGTKVCGYLNVRYSYQPDEENEPMGIAFYYYDANGEKIPTGGGSCKEKDGIWQWTDVIQAYDALPDSIWIEAKVIDSDVRLGRIECKIESAS